MPIHTGMKGWLGRNDESVLMFGALLLAALWATCSMVAIWRTAQ